MYTARGIILQRRFFREKDALYHVFTREYGRIPVWMRISKTCPPVDLGAVVRCSVETRHAKNTCKEYSIVRAIDPSDLDYARLKNILDILALLERTLPEGLEHTTLFDDYCASLPYLLAADSCRLATNVLLIKTAKLFGILPQGIIESDDAIRRLSVAVERYPIDRVHRVQGVTAAMLETIERSVMPHVLDFASKK